jgi:predicted short-subunit dehydrogenase-like oxidoreductase (DUF2520 family)
MHPLQTFPTAAAAAEKLSGAYVFIEGDEAAAAALDALARAIGGRPVRISAEAKALYHAAACTACNYLTALLDAARQMGRLAGIDEPDFLQAVRPLVLATVENVFAMGPAAALTGPIERGDAATVRRQLAAVVGCEEAVRAAFRAMGKLTVDLAARKHSLDASAAAALKAMFDEPHTEE